MEIYGKRDLLRDLNVAAEKFGWGWRTSWSNHRKQIKITQQCFFPNTYLAENSKAPQFWVKQINYWLSVRKDSSSSLSAFSREMHTWKNHVKFGLGNSGFHPNSALMWNVHLKAQPGSQERDGCTVGQPTFSPAAAHPPAHSPSVPGTGWKFPNFNPFSAKNCLFKQPPSTRDSILSLWASSTAAVAPQLSPWQSTEDVGRKQL